MKFYNFHPITNKNKNEVIVLSIRQKNLKYIRYPHLPSTLVSERMTF